MNHLFSVFEPQMDNEAVGNVPIKRLRWPFVLLSVITTPARCRRTPIAGSVHSEPPETPFVPLAHRQCLELG